MILPQGILDLALLAPAILNQGAQNPTAPGPAGSGPAGPAGPAGPGTVTPGASFPWIPMLAIGVLFYFLLIAPERKRKQAREELLGGLGKNDEVMTTGGIFGTISKIDGETVTLRVDEGTHIRVARGSIQGRIGDEMPPA